MQFDIAQNSMVIVALIGAVASILTSLLVFFNQRKQNLGQLKSQNNTDDNEKTKMVLDYASKSLEQWDILTGRIAALEEENERLRDKIEKTSAENEDLKRRLALFERTLLENPIYRAFFELTQFACLIVDADTGMVFDANHAFATMYGYSESEIVEMNAGDFSVQKDATIASLKERTPYVGNRLHVNNKGESFFVEVYSTYYTKDTKTYGLCIYLPRSEATLASRINGILGDIVRNYPADYATLWCLHNHGSNKVSALYDSVATGNAFFLQDYQSIPASMFEDIASYLKENPYLVVREDAEGYTSIKSLLRHASMKSCLIGGIFDNSQHFIGVMSVAWSLEAPPINEDLLKDFLRYAHSEVAKEAILKEVEMFLD